MCAYKDVYDTCTEDKLLHPGRTSGTEGETDEGKESNPSITDTNQVVKEIGQVAFMLLNFTSLSHFQAALATAPLPILFFVKYQGRQGGWDDCRTLTIKCSGTERYKLKPC